MTDRPSDPAPAPRLDASPVTSSSAEIAATSLMRAERAAGGELVDEAERRRLDRLAGGDHHQPAGWRPYLFVPAGTPSPVADDRAEPTRSGAGPLAYGAFVLATDAAGTTVGDLALLTDTDRRGVLEVGLERLAELATDAGAGHLVVWFRRAGDADLATATAAGFDVERRLAVLGRTLPVEAATRPPSPPDGVTVRAFRDGDDDEVVRVLAAAYADTADAGWDREAFATRRSWDWFRAEDLLVADRGDGHLLGLHWLKRRDATTGEVHNLAIDPAAQGTGLGAVLLRAGLDHLATIGCREVVLWVDRANVRAVHLYTRAGFVTRWDDVALGRRLAPAGPALATA